MLHIFSLGFIKPRERLKHQIHELLHSNNKQLDSKFT